MDDDAPPGVPEWVVTYGDMMSLLLTFFIMLVSLSEVVAESKYRAIMEAARQYLGYNGAPLAPPGKNFPLNAVVETLSTVKLGSVSDDENGLGGVKQKGPEGTDLKVTRLREGESQLAGRPLVFAEGQFELTEQLLSEVADLAKEVAGKPHKLEIRLFSSKFVAGIPQTAKQRMDTSFARGEAILEQMVANRVNRNRLRLAIYFHTPHLPSSSQSSLPQDRAEITIYDEYADTFIGREEDYR